MFLGFDTHCSQVKYYMYFSDDKKSEAMLEIVLNNGPVSTRTNSLIVCSFICYERAAMLHWE